MSGRDESGKGIESVRGGAGACRRIWSLDDNVVEDNFVEDEEDGEAEDECIEGIPGFSQGFHCTVGDEAGGELHAEEEEDDGLRKDSYIGCG